jgi:tRNA(Ile)-lysidine synthase
MPAEIGGVPSPLDHQALCLVIALINIHIIKRQNPRMCGFAGHRAISIRTAPCGTLWFNKDMARTQKRFPLYERCGLDPAKPVLAGVSGGPDSLCLMSMLHLAGQRVIVAHFNHQLRPEADREEDSVRRLAQDLGLTFVSSSADVRGYAEEQSMSLEEAARTLRYRFLFASAREQAAQAVAVGHTADDQVETILMHFLRGAGLSGLKGMEYCTILPVFDAQIPLVRPLLTMWRTETETYCHAHNLEAHIDATNADTVYFRNRLRHELIPELENYNPRLKESILRTSLSLQGDHAVLQEVIDAAWKNVVREKGKGWVAFDQAELAHLSSGLRRNVFRLAALLLRPASRDIGFEALERANAFSEAPSGRQVDLENGLFLFAEAGKIHLAAYEADLPLHQWPQVRQPLPVGDTRLAEGGTGLELGNGWVMQIETLLREDDGWRQGTDDWSAWLDADRLPEGGLVIRPRRAGDAISPLGMGGQTLKVKDLFINLKIPRRARQQWPLVCAGEQVVWVAGYRIAHPFRITAATRHILHLEIKRPPAP